MANGFVRGLLITARDVFKGATPSDKITPPGYLKMLLNNGVPNIISKTMEPGNGTIRDLTIKYRPRSIAGQSGTTDDCSITATPGYLEADIPAPSYRHIARFFDDATISRYEAEALSIIRTGNPVPPMGIMREIWDLVLDAANGLIQDINGDLLTAQAASFGKNVRTTLATATTVNFTLSTATNPLTAGMTLLETDIQDNETPVTDVVIVGAGLIAGVYRQIQSNTQNTNVQNYPSNAPPFFWDPACTALWGANEFGVFQRNAVQFVNINKFSGPMGGDKLSTFLFTIALPVNFTDSVGDSLQGLKFDVQIRYNDCPREIEIDGNPVSVGRGWIVDLMCNFSQFNIPADSYQSGDRLTGNNGTWLYVATNS